MFPGVLQPPQQLPSIFVGISTHDNRCHSRFLFSMMALLTCGRFKTTVSNVSSGGIHKARNNLAWEFLTKTDAPWYLSADSDMSFHPDHVSRLISRDLDIVGAPYCHKKPQLEWAARCIPGVVADPTTGLQELAAHGTGFLLIKRRVFEAMRKAAEAQGRWFIEDWNEGKGQKKWDLFWEGPIQDAEFGYPERTQLTEDFGFCYWARKLGFKVYVDTTIYVQHWDGGRGYPEQPPPTNPAPAPQAITVEEPVTV